MCQYPNDPTGNRLLIASFSTVFVVDPIAGQVACVADSTALRASKMVYGMVVSRWATTPNVIYITTLTSCVLAIELPSDPFTTPGTVSTLVESSQIDRAYGLKREALIFIARRHHLINCRCISLPVPRFGRINWKKVSLFLSWMDGCLCPCALVSSNVDTAHVFSF